MKKTMHILASITVSALMTSCSRDGVPTREVDETSSKYSAGQVWGYQTRPGEQESRLYIVKTDRDKTLGTIYHIYVDGIAIKNPHMPGGGVQTCLPHSPVSAETLDASVTELLERHRGEMPDISEGYGVWKEGYDKGEAGVFTIPVAEIIAYIEDIVSGKKPQG
jgi:hypothetical protein